MTPPAISPEQRADGLAKAAQSRRIRAAALDKVRDGTVSLAEVLDSTEPAVRKAKVRQVLLALPNVGPAKADRAMEEIVIAPTRRIRGLRHLQRQALLARFPGDRPALISEAPEGRQS
jgi:hypothetical protein